MSSDKAATHDDPQQRRHDSEIVVVHRSLAEREGVLAAGWRGEEEVGSTR